MDATEQLVDEVSSLHRVLVNTAALHNNASEVADTLIDLSETLVDESESAEAAHVALTDLLDIRDTIVAQESEIAKSQATLEDLVQLKDDVLAQTDSIGDAIVTLERTTDLTDQFREASQSFDDVRRWLSDVILMEPTVRRAMDALEPLTELGNLRRVSADELRQAARVVRDIRQADLVRSQQQGDDATEVASKAALDSNR